MIIRSLAPLISLAFFATAAVHAESVASQVLDEINLARTQPQRYAGILSAHASRNPRGAAEAVAFLQKTSPREPLAWSAGISQAALGHALEVGRKGGRGHRNARGESPWERMARFGQWQGHAGENIDYGNSGARAIVISLIVDNGVPSRLHRANLFSRNFRVAGIAVGPHASSGTMCVMDFATGFVGAGEARVASRGGAGYHSAYSGMSFF